MKKCKDKRTYCKSCGGDHDERLASIYVLADDIHIDFNGFTYDETCDVGQIEARKRLMRNISRIMKICRGTK